MQFIETECFQLISSLVLLVVQDGSQSFCHHIHIPGRGRRKQEWILEKMNISVIALYRECSSYTFLESFLRLADTHPG